MSRIWNALKQAEQERAHSSRASVHPAGRAPEPGGDIRGVRGSKQEASLLVYGSDADKQPFHEEAQACEANETGCWILLETPVILGQRLYLVNANNQDEEECRVIRVGRLIRGKRQVGVEFLRAAPSFWRV